MKKFLVKNHVVGYENLLKPIPLQYCYEVCFSERHFKSDRYSDFFYIYYDLVPGIIDIKQELFMELKRK